jgi:hypothetical protein
MLGKIMLHYKIIATKVVLVGKKLSKGETRRALTMSKETNP